MSVWFPVLCEAPLGLYVCVCVGVCVDVCGGGGWGVGYEGGKGRGQFWLPRGAPG